MTATLQFWGLSHIIFLISSLGNTFSQKIIINTYPQEKSVNAVGFKMYCVSACINSVRKK